MIKEVAIYSSFTPLKLPEDLATQLDGGSLAQFRVRLAKYLRENASEAIGTTLEENILYKIDSDIYGILNAELNALAIIRIMKVDTSRKWFISDYDGAESIEYLDRPYTIVDKDLNYINIDWEDGLNKINCTHSR